MLMELSQLIQKLPGDQIQRMQMLMHNTMAGLDVKKEMEEFERSLPPGFREKLMSIMAQSGQSFTGAPPFSTPSFGSPSNQVIDVSPQNETAAPTDPMDLHSARLTLLKAVADGRIPPEEAERLLFK